MLTLSNALFLRPNATLGSVSRQLLRALNSAGYEEHSFRCVRGGFLLATQVERIRPDKTPFPGDKRFDTEAPALLDVREGFSISRIIEALVNADPGRYRVLLFYVTDQPVTPTDRPAGTDVQGLPTSGPDELPDDFSRFRYASAYRVRALVYEFARPAVAAPMGFVPSSGVSTRTHLRRAGLRSLQP